MLKKDGLNYASYTVLIENEFRKGTWKTNSFHCSSYKSMRVDIKSYMSEKNMI